MKGAALINRALAIFAIVAGSTQAVALAASADELLRAADKYRSPTPNMQVETSVVIVNPDGSIAKERSYTVFSQAKRHSLVIMRSPAEKGQKVLMLGDDFWLLMPSSQRPMRITPMQKLLGDASTGDIATMNWADEYEAKLTGEESCVDVACVHLSLTAARKGATYQRIELWIAKSSGEPIKADLYVQSEKLAKTAAFVIAGQAGKRSVSEMVLVDKLSNRKETRVKYLGRKERVVPEAWLNPMFLTTNPSIE